MQWGQTVLIIAAMTGSEDTIDVLLNVKDINVMSKDFVSLIKYSTFS